MTNVPLPTLTNVKSADVVDKLVGEKIAELRLLMGITRQQLAEKVGVTHQQLHKYEKGINRISVGRLATIAECLNVSVSHFFDNDNWTPEDSTLKRRHLELLRDYKSIKSDSQQEAIRQLVRTLAAAYA